MRLARTMATTGWWLRLLLLVGTLFGLAAMHTLGHDAHVVGGHRAGHGASTGTGHTVGRLTMVPDVGQGCAGDGCATARPAGQPGAPSPGWSVCLAMLGALTVAVLLVLLFAVRTRPAAVARPPSRPREPRAPPPRPVGLRLASVSVLRR
ncbi:hypothetical protein [Micromonospora sp. NPDC092111]|uniref:hypothetical protein n=1 Tax=Micromonospora sp. NPDC092111 TaxID=3364289 RepID=UPI0038022A33